jgi:tRNA(Leu) C34 or U34 (ribose-2'-O)-methylase TrmL
MQGAAAMRGYFGIGVEAISKSMNLGNLIRSAHAFGASFFFTVNAAFNAREVAQSDTSGAMQHVPLYTFDAPEELLLPRGCQLIGIEFTEDSEELPSFRHPLAAAYVLGREKGSLSEAMQARCDAVVKIPTKFCVNVGTAGAIVMYDRLISQGRFARRPVSVRGRPEAVPEPGHGEPWVRPGRSGRADAGPAETGAGAERQTAPDAAAGRAAGDRR